jgi:hypothetical protein
VLASACLLSSLLPLKGKKQSNKTLASFSYPETGFLQEKPFSILSEKARAYSVAHRDALQDLHQALMESERNKGPEI